MSRGRAEGYDRRQLVAAMYEDGATPAQVAVAMGSTLSVTRTWQHSWRSNPEAFVDESYGRPVDLPSIDELAVAHPLLRATAKGWVTFFTTDVGNEAFQDVVREILLHRWDEEGERTRGPDLVPEPKEQSRRFRLLFSEFFDEDDR